MGHSLLSESREFERGVTAAVNASVQPLLERYVVRLAGELRGRGYARDLLVMNGNGGMVAADKVSREAVKTVMSGPASGVMAAVATGRRAGMAHLLTYDMGGTSTDVAMIKDGKMCIRDRIRDVVMGLRATGVATVLVEQRVTAVLGMADRVAFGDHREVAAVLPCAGLAANAPQFARYVGV